jgi:hypothetical protein
MTLLSRSNFLPLSYSNTTLFNGNSTTNFSYGISNMEGCSAVVSEAESSMEGDGFISCEAAG